MTILTDIVAVFANWVWPLLQFLIGVGLVIFVHELGHFLAAKAVNIKVEKFAMGIGPRLWGFRRGETEYCLNLLLPLGGYVKMLGQDDVRPPVEQAKSGAPGESASDKIAFHPVISPPRPQPAASGGEAPAPPDAAPAEAAPPEAVVSPRAFQNKSVGQRMLVISGGVAMNVVFGVLLFIVVGLVGKPFPAPIVGDVVPGSPAALAPVAWRTPPAATPATSPAWPDANVGLRPGDRVVRVDDGPFFLKLVNRNVDRFDKLILASILAGPADRYTLTFQREVGGQTLVGKVRMAARAGPEEAGAGRKGFGIAAPRDTVIGQPDFRSALPFRPGDRVVSIGGVPIQHGWDILGAIDALDGNRVDVVVLREGNRVAVPLQPVLGFWDRRIVAFDRKDGSRLIVEPGVSAEANLVRVRSADGNRREVLRTNLLGVSDKEPREPLDILGMLPRIRVGAVEIDWSADKAGVQPEDVIYQYGDVRGPTRQALSQVNNLAADKGTKLLLLRGGKLVGPLEVTPKRRGKDSPPLLGFTPTADVMHPVLAGVREGSPAAAGGLRAGDVVRQANGRPVETWTDLYRAACQARGEGLWLQVQRGDRTVEANLGPVTAAVFDPSDYRFSPFADGVTFEPLTVTIRKGPLAAAAWGVELTWEFIISQYAWLRQLIAGEASPKEDAAGPLRLGQLAVHAAREGPMHLFYLMAVISACVAVINFLPFPVLDGGHAAMLVLEKIRGRPLPVKVQWVLQLFGLACILLLFLLVTWNDLAHMVGW